MTYKIVHPNLGTLDMDSGDDVMILDAQLRATVPGLEGWSYSFADDTLTVDAPLGAEAALSAWGEAVTLDG